MKRKIILASTSPRRRGLLQQIGLEFEIIPSKYEEDMTLKLPPHKLAMTLARGKALDVAQRVSKGIVIGADTFIVLDNKILGKPKNKEDAKRMLRKSSGKTQNVYSGVAMIDAKTKKELVGYEVTRIKIRKIDDEEIEKYVATGEPLDKAGALCPQGLGAIFVEKIDGCYSNVIGLPLHCLFKNLKKFGVNIFEYERWRDYIH